MRYIFIKTIAALFIIFISCSLSMAQQDPVYTQYIHNMLSINPAIAGTTSSGAPTTESFINLNSITRLQWVGMEGSPSTFSFGAHMPLENKKVGIGVTLITDEVGPVSNTHFTINYAYRIKVFENMTLSMGIKGGITSYRADINNLTVIDENDPNFVSDEQKIMPNLGFGFYLYNQKYFVGFSVPKLLETSIDEEYASSFKELKRHYYIVAGYNLDLTPNWTLKPTIYTRAVSGAPSSNDITLHAIYDKRFDFGVMYRIGDAFGAFVDVQVNNQLALGYGYDFSTNSLLVMNSGTHELVITYEFNDFKKRRPLIKF